MNKEVFLKVLEKKLRILPKEERVQALEYYREYLEEGSVEELGSVDDVAKQIIDQCAIKTLENKEKHGSLKAFWIVLLAVFAAPVALPVAIAVGAVIFGVLVAVGAVILALLVSGIAVWLCGFLWIAIGIYIVSKSIVNAVMLIGLGLMSVGGGILVVMGIIYGSKALARLFTYLFGKKIKRGENA